MSIDIKSFISLVKKYQTNILKKDKALSFLKDYPTDILITIISKAKKAVSNREVAIELLFTRTGPEIDQALMSAAKESSGPLQLSIIKELSSRPGKIIDLFLMEFVINNQARPDYEIFKTIFKALADRPGQMITGFLMDSVWSEQAFILTPAIEALTNRPGTEVDQTLIKCAMDKRWNRHQGAFEALRTRPGETIDKVLIAAAKNEGEFSNNDTGCLSNGTEYLESIRWAAAKAMRGRFSKEIDEVLISLTKDDCGYTRLAAIKAMAGRDNPIIKKVLQRMSKVKGLGHIKIAETASYILSGGVDVD